MPRHINQERDPYSAREVHRWLSYNLETGGMQHSRPNGLASGIRYIEHESHRLGKWVIGNSVFAAAQKPVTEVVVEHLPKANPFYYGLGFIVALELTPAGKTARSYVSFDIDKMDQPQLDLLSAQGIEAVQEPGLVELGESPEDNVDHPDTSNTPALHRFVRSLDPH